MKFVPLITIFLPILVQANLHPRQAGKCPDVWNQVSKDLTRMFATGDGQCNDDARAAIRASFHDCGTWNKAQGNTGGCDGSVILSAEENGRMENRGLQEISAKLKNLATERKVSVADMIAFAGSHATVSCPLGPTVKTLVGRKDSDKAAPKDVLPSSPQLSADQIISMFEDKGFNPGEVSALVGAHSTAKQFFTDPSKAGTPQDRTPGIWDVDFYDDTFSQPKNVFVFQSDMALAKDSRSGPAFQAFRGQQGRWNAAFASSYAKLIMLGVPQDGLVDCTAALPKPVTNFPGANTPAPNQGQPQQPKGGKGKDPKNGNQPKKGKDPNRGNQPKNGKDPNRGNGNGNGRPNNGKDGKGGKGGGKGNGANDPFTGGPNMDNPPRTQGQPQDPSQPNPQQPGYGQGGYGGYGQHPNRPNGQDQNRGQPRGDQNGQPGKQGQNGGRQNGQDRGPAQGRPNGQGQDQGQGRPQQTQPPRNGQGKKAKRSNQGQGKGKKAR